MKPKHIEGLTTALEQIGVVWLPFAPVVEQDTTYVGADIRLYIYGNGYNEFTWSLAGQSGILNFGNVAVTRYISAQDATLSRAVIVVYDTINQQIVVRESALAAIPSYPTKYATEVLISQFIVPPTGQAIQPVQQSNTPTFKDVYLTDLVSTGRQPIDVDTTGLLGKMVYDRYGFVDPFTETTISFNDSTRVFTLARTGASFRYYRAGILYTITENKTVTIPNTAGRYFVYIDATDGTLSQSLTAWTLQDTKVPVAIVNYKPALTPKYFLAEERHPYSLDRADHYYLHTTRGAQLTGGGNLLNTTTPAGNPSGNVDNCFGLDASAILDENITNTIAAFARPNGSTPTYTVKYRSATAPTAWAWQSAQNVPYLFANAANIYYDNAGILTQVTNNQYVNYYVVLTNYATYGCLVLMGQAQYPTSAAAYAETLSNLDLTNLGTSEFVFIAQLTFECRSAYSAASGNVKLVRYQKLNNSSASVVLSPSTVVSGSNVNVNYTPVNYTTSAPDLTSNITGIDLELNKWKTITAYTTTPASTSSITVGDLTSKISAGMCIRAKISGSFVYGIVSAITSNTITVKGAPLSGTMTELYFCDSRNMIVSEFQLDPKTLNTTVTNALTDYATSGNYSNADWAMAPSRIVLVAAKALSKGSGSSPQFNIKNQANSNILTSAITIAANDTMYDSGITVDPAQNRVILGDVLKMNVTVAGTAATQVTLRLISVFE